MSMKIMFEREVHVTRDKDEEAGRLSISCQVEPDHAVCRFVIPGVESVERQVYGEDALQALRLCLAHVQSRIIDAEKRGVIIWWLEPGDRAGFHEVGRAAD